LWFERRLRIGRERPVALEVPELSPRGLAVRFTDEQKYFVSEASVYRRRLLDASHPYKKTAG
jgi:hypothetical protein